MSTKKVRDGTSRPLATTTKTRKPAETTKKETSKTKTTSRVQSKRQEDEDEKVKKTVLKSRLSQNPDKKVSRPALVKKTASTAKPPSSKPVTPPSSRVTKTQFFPSKKMYSHALKRDSNKPVKAMTSAINSVPSPKVVVKPVDDESPDTSSVSERPRTATLPKGSIVNKNIVGPDVPKAKVPAVVKVETPQVEYEDDFDSYESDFDEYNSSDSSTSTNQSGGTSSAESTEGTESESTTLKSTPKRVSSAGTDDEKKLDSGNYELPESRHRQILDNIKESIEKENANLTLEHNRSNLGSLSDEGFEDGKSLQFINFLGAQRKYQHRKSVELRRKRGEEILSMIRLDQYSFTLFELAPVPYDVFIKSFGKSNSVQASVQTGEDDLDEEVQTDKVAYCNKWTQYPPHFSKPDENDDFWSTYKCNYVGVGGDLAEEKQENSFNESNLEKFLLATGNLILNLQAEANIQTSAETDKTNIPFSKGFVFYNTQSCEMLKHRPVNDVAFCLSNSNKILTVHGTKAEDNYEKSVICLWSLSNVDTPEMLFFAFGEVTCCNFSVECPSILFGGLKSGTLAIWDMSENSTYHQKVYNGDDALIRSPTYSTGVNYGHCCKIVSIQSLTSSSSDQNLFSLQRASEVCSLDEQGDIIVWSVIFKEKNHSGVVTDQGLAHWGSVILTINNKISLKNLYPEMIDFNCTDLTLSQFDSNNLYISTSYGIIIHCLATGGKPTVKKFLPENQSQANCLEMCPFSSEYLLAGFDNGDTSLYSRFVEKPLMVLSNKDTVERKSKIQKIQWSHNRPLVFYTKDVANIIHVWNLKVSDIFPIYSVPFKDNIVCMKLSPQLVSHAGALEKTYMIIATDNGLIYVHLLGDDHDQQSLDEFERDKTRFLNYINRYV